MPTIPLLAAALLALLAQHHTCAFSRSAGMEQLFASFVRMKTRPQIAASKSKVALPPWNKSLAVGRKKPFSPEEVLQICQYLTAKKHWRDLALLAVGLDTGFRASDLLALRFADLEGMELVRKQQKTQKNVTVRLSDYSHQVLLHWAILRDLGDDDALFCGLQGQKSKAIARWTLAQCIKNWAQAIGLNPKFYSTHSLRRTKGAAVYAHCGDVEIVRIFLGQSDTKSTSAYLGIDEQKALAVAQQVALLPEEFEP